MIKKIIQIYRILLTYVLYSKRAQYLTLITLLLTGLDTLATTSLPYIWRDLIHAENLTKPLTWFIYQAVILFIVWFFIKSLPYLGEIVFFPVTNQAIKEIGLKTTLKVHSVSVQVLEKYNIQEIISATSRISQSLRSFMRVSFSTIVPSLAKMVSLSIALLTVHSLCWGIMTAAYVALGAAIFCLPNYIYEKSKAWNLTDQVKTVMGETLYHTATIRFQPAAKTQELSKLFDLEAEGWQHANFYFYLLHLVNNFVFFVGAGVSFCLLALQYKQGLVQLDKLVLVYGLIGAMHLPLRAIISSLTSFFSGVVDLTKTLEILHLPAEDKPLSLPTCTPQAIRLVEVSFGYEGAKPVLEQVNLTIYPGDKVGIMGVSGVGKSTLCQVMTGLLMPDAGQVWYGDLPLGKINPASLGQVLCYLPQGNPMQELVVLSLADGITIQKEKFSGGEYQQHMLRKALAYKPQIAILDETFNALDRPTAEHLLEEVMAVVPTLVLVSHSQSLLQKMQRIIVLGE